MVVERRRLVRRVPERLKEWWIERVVNEFARIYYQRSGQTWMRTYWLGTQILKNPADMWIYQEILHEVRPQLIIETGTAHGGSALFLASICDLLEQGRVVTVDVAALEGRPDHPRISYVQGSSTDEAIVGDLAKAAETSKPVLVILDSDHSKHHVLQELRTYSDLVTQGSFLIVEDTNINGHPVMREAGPGPMEAVQEFLARRQPVHRRLRPREVHDHLQPWRLPAANLNATAALRRECPARTGHAS